MDRLVYTFRAPIVAWSGYEDLITEQMKDRVMIERLADNIRNSSLEEASDYEAMLYCHTASLAGPMNDTWFKTYTYLFSKFYAEQAKSIGVYRAELDDYCRRELLGLKRWIYRIQRGRIKEKDRG